MNSRARRLRRLAGAAVGRPVIGPEVVSLETTHHCNLRCSFCESHGIHQEKPITSRRKYRDGKTSMNLDTVRRLALELAAAGTDMVELSGKGDPIAHPDLTAIVAGIKDAGLKCALVTNGTLASPDLAPTLVERNLDRLSVSLNAGGSDVYLRSNHRDLWDKANTFLRNVLELKRGSRASRPWVRVTHVVTRENVGDMDKMVQVCADLGADEVSFLVMGELPETKSLQLDAGDVEGIRAGSEKWGRILGDAGVEHNLRAFVGDLTNRVHGGRRQDNPLQKKIPCYVGWIFCVIAPDGAVLPCCYCEETELGNVNETGFREIWKGATYKKFRRDCLEMPSTGRPICGECFTSCNRAFENRWVYNKLHPFKPVPLEIG